MANHVKIKKSKNLRFKLISLLYLLFISLSIIQIPIEWLRINGPVTSYFLKSRSEKIKVAELDKPYQFLLQLDGDFTKMITDDKTGKFIEPNEYAKTDQFFIKDKHAFIIHSELKSLNEYYTKQPANNPAKKTFQKLFKEDLDNGLMNTDATVWAEWKFKHAPAAVAKSLMAELQLRLNLLNGEIQVKDNALDDETIVRMAFNIENLRVGDSLKIVVKNKKYLKASVTEGAQTLPLNNWLGDTLLFVPQHIGKFDFEFDRNGIKEKFHLTSVTKGFTFNDENKFQTFIEGKKSKLTFSGLPNANNVSCDCDGNAILKRSSGYIEFTPQKSGWCKFKIASGKNLLLLYDSIFIQAIPIPYIIVDGSTENKISYNRLMQTKTISFEANHPEMPGTIYKVGSVKLRLIGIDNSIKTINGNSMSCTDEQIKNLRYIIVECVNVKSSFKNFEILKQLVIQINK